jgi:protein TonB
MVRTLPLDSESRPDLSRILGIAAAIAVHALAFMLLLVPMATPAPVALLPDEKPVVDWDMSKPDPVTPTPPETVRVQQPRAKPQPQPRVVPDSSMPINDQVLTDPGETVEPAFDSTDNVVPTEGDIGTPLSGVRLEYALAKAPPYPREAFRQGLQGQVLLKILVDTDGKPLEVVVATSSGHRALDDAARRFVLNNWRFKPAMRNGNAVQAYGMVPIDFTLQ